jgi:hypothetical protein
MIAWKNVAGCRPGVIIEIEKGMPCTPFRYVNNFLFIPPDEPEATFARIAPDLARRN